MNINGEVVGINTAIRGGGAQGLGFATPINTAKRLLPQLKQGKVTRGYLGMGIIDVTEDARDGVQSRRTPAARSCRPSSRASRPTRPASSRATSSSRSTASRSATTAS